MSVPEARAEFADVVARPAFDLAEAALLVARAEYPALDVARYLARLDEMATAAEARLARVRGVDAAVRTFNAYLFDEMGFRGNELDYYDPRNSFLNDVLDRRLGIPISLALIYMEVGRRAGLAAFGVGLPGHFIVRVERAGAERLVDPFLRGARLTQRDCQRRLDRVFAGRVKLAPHMLASCDSRSVLARVLRNLKAIYVKHDDCERALGVVEMLLRLDPGALEERRDRGLLYAAMDCYARAADDLDAYLERAPAAPEAPELTKKVAALRRQAARVH